jgi:PAS domain S-box-containing protein
MHRPLQDPAEEIKRLQRCISDLVSVLALPAAWTGAEPSRIISTFLDALLGMLRLDFVYARLNDRLGESPFEMVRSAPSQHLTEPPQEFRELVSHLFSDDPNQWPPDARLRVRVGDLSLVPLQMGLHAEIGVIVAGARRGDFPNQTERLVLNVAANQAAIGIREAQIRNEQKRAAQELDRRVAQRTNELAQSNEELQLQVGLLQHLPVSTWTLRPDGTPDFVNRVWLDFSGQTLDFVRSHPEAWMTAVHPEDREAASKALWEGVRSGQGFAFETRSLRAQDGTWRWHLQQAVVLRDAEGKVIKFVGTTTDIDDQKRAQEEVRASEANLRQILDCIPGLVCTMSSAGQVELPNRRLLEFFGRTLEEVNSWATNDLVHPDDLPRVTAEVIYSFTNGTPYDSELRYRRADGVYRWFQVRIVPVRDTADTVTGWYGLITDIEDRKRAEEELRRSERDLNSIVNTIPAMAWATQADGFCDFMNQHWLDFTGLSPEQGRGWGWSAAIHPDDLNGLVEYWQSHLASGAPVDVEARMRRFDGEYRWFLFRANPLRDASGNILRWYGTNTDIDDRKRAEDELRRSEAFLTQGQRLNLTGSFSWYVDSGEITFSDQLFRIFELDPDAPVTLEQIGRRVHPEDIPLLTEKMELARKDLNDQDYGIRLRMPDGRVKYLRTKSSGIRHPDGRLERIGAIQDVTEQRLAEEALSRLRSELAHVARFTSLGALTASIAHEVNQPLSGIVTNASTCLRMLAAEPPNIDGARETARRTIRDGERANDVIKRLRTLFTRKEIAIESVDLNEAVREVIALSQDELQRNQVILRHDLAEDLPPVKGDRVQLQQVILNLLRNGSDAMSGVEDRLRLLMIRTRLDAENYVRLSVQDEGIGIDLPDLNKLFDAFYTTKSAGMGIGLSVSRSIIESHHGRLWAEPNDGQGATFSFALPGSPDSGNPGLTEASVASDVVYSMRKL